MKLLDIDILYGSEGNSAPHPVIRFSSSLSNLKQIIIVNLVSHPLASFSLSHTFMSCKWISLVRCHVSDLLASSSQLEHTTC